MALDRWRGYCIAFVGRWVSGVIAAGVLCVESIVPYVETFRKVSEDV